MGLVVGGLIALRVARVARERGLVLARLPLHYVQVIGNASRTVGPIALQYPFYALSCSRPPRCCSAAHCCCWARPEPE
jgi:hypothetical protein